MVRVAGVAPCCCSSPCYLASPCYCSACCCSSSCCCSTCCASCCCASSSCCCSACSSPCCCLPPPGGSHSPPASGEGETSPSLPLVSWLHPNLGRGFGLFILSTPTTVALVSGGYVPVPVRGYPAATAPLKRSRPRASMRRLAARKRSAPPAGASLAGTAPPVLCGQRANPARRPGPDLDSPPRPPSGGSRDLTLPAGQGSRANTARRPWLAPPSQPHHQELQGPRANPARRPRPEDVDSPPAPRWGVTAARSPSHGSGAGPRASGHPLRSTSPGGWCCGRPWPSRPRRSAFRFAPSLRRQVQLCASRAGRRSCQAPAPTPRGGLDLEDLIPPVPPEGGAGGCTVVALVPRPPRSGTAHGRLRKLRPPLRAPALSGRSHPRCGKRGGRLLPASRRPSPG